MPGWRELRVDGLGPIERVVAVFRIGPPLACLPFPSFKVKVVERPRADGIYSAVLNVSLRDTCGEAGLGDTIDEALEDALRRFALAVNARPKLAAEDFVWADPEEF